MKDRNKVIITESVIREMVNDALDNYIPINPSPVTDPKHFESMPEDDKYVPQNKQELSVTFQGMLRDVPIEEIPRLFKVIKDTLTTKEDTETPGDKETMKKNAIEEQIRAAVRKIIKEVNPKFDYNFSGYEYGSGDDDEDDDDLNDPSLPKKKLNTVSDVEGGTFDSIATKLGLSVAGAKRAVDMAIEKAGFVAKLDRDELEMTVLIAVGDYIEMLRKSGELSPADVQLLKDHPEIVRTLDGFREYLHTSLKRLKKSGHALTDTSNNPFREARERAPKLAGKLPKCQACGKHMTTADRAAYEAEGGSGWPSVCEDCAELDIVRDRDRNRPIPAGPTHNFRLGESDDPLDEDVMVDPKVEQAKKKLMKDLAGGPIPRDLVTADKTSVAAVQQLIKAGKVKADKNKVYAVKESVGKKKRTIRESFDQTPPGYVIGSIQAHIPSDYRYNEVIKVFYDEMSRSVHVMYTESSAMGGMDTLSSESSWLTPKIDGPFGTDEIGKIMSAIKRHIKPREIIARYGKPTKNFKWTNGARGLSALNLKAVLADLESGE